MVRNFKGEVKISDVQAEFDNLVDRINNMVDSYNISGKVEDIDYSVGGANLSPTGYTLSIGGLKQGLEAVEGNVIGAKCFSIDDARFKVTDGLIITKKGAIRLPDKIINKSSENSTLFFDTQANDYVLGTPTSYQGSDTVFRICDMNINRDSKFITNINSIQVENFDGKYDITSESKTFGSSETLRTSNISRNKHEQIFISGIDAERFEREGTSHVYFLGDDIAWNSQPGHRNLNYWTPVNMLYVPKGVDDPFEVTNGNASKSFKVIIDKKVE